jgi:DnaK suppressor protein
VILLTNSGMSIASLPSPAAWTAAEINTQVVIKMTSKPLSKLSSESYKKFDEPKTYMDDSHRAHFKSILSTRRLQLLEDDASLVRLLQDDSASGHSRQSIADPLDRAAQNVDQHLELRALRRLRKLVAKIDSSIDLINQNEYGYCNTCSIEIGTLRLQARPTASQCIDCKNLAERKARQSYG